MVTIRSLVQEAPARSRATTATLSWSASRDRETSATVAAASTSSVGLRNEIDVLVSRDKDVLALAG